MPHRFEPIFATLIATVCAVLSATCSSALAVVEQLAAGGAIIDDGMKRLICVSGALGGGLLSALLFTPPKTTGRGFVVKLASSTLASILFTPMAISWFGWSPNVDMLLGFSAVMALGAVSLIRAILPLWEKYAATKFSPPVDPPRTSFTAPKNETPPPP